MLKFKELYPNIYAVEADTTQQLAKLFVRFQEYYESPHFKGKVFTLKEFETWYKKFTKKSKFTYYNDWSGFNIPGHIVDDFATHFSDLSKDEMWLLRKVMAKRIPKRISINGGYSARDRFYIIGYQKGQKGTKLHELAHAKYHIDPSYAVSCVLELARIKKSTRNRIFAHFEKIGYNKSVFWDELQAYIIADKSYLKSKRLWTKELDLVQKRLKLLFDNSK